MVQSTSAGMKKAIPIRPEWTAPFWPEWNVPFHPGQNGMGHFNPAGIKPSIPDEMKPSILNRMKHSIPDRMEWIISFRPEWNVHFIDANKKYATRKVSGSNLLYACCSSAHLCWTLKHFKETNRQSHQYRSKLHEVEVLFLFFFPPKGPPFDI